MLAYSKNSRSGRPASTVISRKNENGSASTIQKKLTIGKSNDRYEREADHVADHVVKQTTGSDSMVQNQITSMQTSQVQKMGEDEEVQAKSNGSGQSQASAAVSAGIKSSRGGGSPLPLAVRTKMENSIGADFSSVRVHNDSKAHQLSNQLNAQAFTVGNDVYFNKGKYNPESQSGKHLLAHELTHTIQQGAAIQTQIQKQELPEENPYQLQVPQLGDSLRNQNPYSLGVGPLEMPKAPPVLFPPMTMPENQIPGLDPNAPIPQPAPQPIDYLRGDPNMNPADYGKLGVTIKPNDYMKLFLGGKWDGKPKAYGSFGVSF